MSQAKNYQEKIVPQRLTLTGSTDDEYVIRKKDGSPVLVITGDGKMGFNGLAPAAQGAAITAAVVAAASFTHQAPGAQDFAIQNAVQNTGFGFVTANEMNSTLQALQNALLRIEQIEARLEAAGIIAAN